MNIACACLICLSVSIYECKSRTQDGFSDRDDYWVRLNVLWEFSSNKILITPRCMEVQ